MGITKNYDTHLSQRTWILWLFCTARKKCGFFFITKLDAVNRSVSRYYQLIVAVHTSKEACSCLILKVQQNGKSQHGSPSIRQFCLWCHETCNHSQLLIDAVRHYLSHAIQAIQRVLWDRAPQNYKQIRVNGLDYSYFLFLGLYCLLTRCLHQPPSYLQFLNKWEYRVLFAHPQLEWNLQSSQKLTIRDTASLRNPSILSSRQVKRGCSPKASFLAPFMIGTSEA